MDLVPCVRPQKTHLTPGGPVAADLTGGCLPDIASYYNKRTDGRANPTFGSIALIFVTQAAIYSLSILADSLRQLPLLALFRTATAA